MKQEEDKSDIVTLERVVYRLKHKIACRSVVKYPGVYNDGYREALGDMLNEFEGILIRRKQQEMDIIKLDLEHWGERFHPLSAEELIHLALRAVSQAIEKDNKTEVKNETGRKANV